MMPEWQEQHGIEWVVVMEGHLAAKVFRWRQHEILVEVGGIPVRTESTITTMEEGKRVAIQHLEKLAQQLLADIAVLKLKGEA